MNIPVDKLPPTFVRDWWRLLHQKGYIVLAVLAFVISLLVLITEDWPEVYELARRAAADSAGESYGCWCSPMHSLCQRMADINLFQALCAMSVVALLIPLRIGAAVASDTGVKGTNFLQVTPLGSWRIVTGMWLSAFSQVLLVAAVAVPVLLLRAKLMPTGNDADWYGLLYLVAAGASFSAAYMFISGLTQMVRYLLMAVLVILGLLLTMTACEGREFCPSQIPVWLLGVHMLTFALISLLFLHLARRPYAAPAENTAWPARLVILACFAVALCCQAVDVWDTFANPEGESIPSFGLGFPLYGLLIAGTFGAVMDAVLPVNPLPAQAKRTVRWLPEWLQTPGVWQSALFLLIPAFTISLCACCHDINHYLPSVVERGLMENCLYGGLAGCAVLTLLMWTPALLCLGVGDMFVSRKSQQRPLAMALVFVSLLILIVIARSAAGDTDAMFIPMTNIETFLDDVWYGYMHSLHPYFDYNDTAIETGIFTRDFFIACAVAVVEAALALGLVYARVSRTPSQR